MNLTFKLSDVPERIESIDKFVNDAVQAENLREEEFLRTHAPIFINQGYRLKELSLHRNRRLAMKPEMDSLYLLPTRPVDPAILELRKLWRNWFPYKMPKARSSK
jgi:hypothetical protein